MRKGFTLVELVIVIAILGILAAVAIPKYLNLVDEARESATKGALGGLRSAMAIFYAKEAIAGAERFPTSTTELRDAMAQGTPPNAYREDTASTLIVATAAVPTETNAAAWILCTVTTITDPGYGRVWAANSLDW